ncbi:MAG TPA: DUF5060 domain-containing protein [Verrucomicrobiae bacterium]|nr:DUF5060 domain-containing protein [Verrucomicrobiae bacterium]
MAGMSLSGKWISVAIAVACSHAPCLGLQVEVESTEPASGDVPRFGKWEIAFDVSGTWENPYDPEEIDVTAEFTSASGKVAVVPGFFYQGFQNRYEGDDSKRPILDEVGAPCWKARFSPVEVGPYSCVVRARAPKAGSGAVAESGRLTFRCVESGAPGFIRVCQRNKRYFEFDDQRPFFSVGQNLQNDWPVYRHSRLLAEGGANCVRAWTFCHYTWLEWTPASGVKWAKPGDWILSYGGAGKYNQRIAWIADRCLEQWGRDGIRVMLCLGNGTGGGELSKGGGYGSWDGHPYNVANGGFLDDPKKFWTDASARKLYKQRLRYIAARYGYSANIWAWEFWNELGEATPEIAAWHREMTEYLRGVDPNGHLMTSSTWQWVPGRFAAVWDLDGMGFTQSHIYAPLPAMVGRIGAHLAAWAKPHIVGEGGGPATDAVGGEDAHKDAATDPDGIDFHNSLWAPVMLGAGGTTLPWWWRQRIEPRNLFPQYRAIANFVRDVPWATRAFHPFRADSIQLLEQKGRARYSPVLVVPLGGGWGQRAGRARFEVGPDGSVSGIDEFGAELFGGGRQAWRNPPTLEVNFPQAGQFIVHVADASHGILEIRVDGTVSLRETSLNVPKRAVNRSFSVDVAAGRHEIQLDNAGPDFIRVGHVMLTNYRDASHYPDLEIFGVRADDMALLWAHDRLNEWAFKAAGLSAEKPVGPATVRIGGLKDGRYRVAWWDTYQGVVTREEDAECGGGFLELRLPAIGTDVACKIARKKAE